MISFKPHKGDIIGRKPHKGDHCKIGLKPYKDYKIGHKLHNWFNTSQR